MVIGMPKFLASHIHGNFKLERPMIIDPDIQKLSLVKKLGFVWVCFILDHDALKDEGNSNGWNNYMKSCMSRMIFNGMLEFWNSH